MNDLDTLSKRLQHARRRLDLSKRDVARAAGISEPAYLKLERGDNKASAYIVQIAQALKVSPVWLSTGKGEINPGKIDALVLDSSVQNANNDPPIKKWSELLTDKGAGLFRYQMAGDSMAGAPPLNIPHGSMLTIDIDAAGQVGRVHLASVDGFPAFGVLQSHGPSMRLVPSNSAYNPIEISRDSLIGVITNYTVSLP